jgi:hypothetical protein
MHEYNINEDWGFYIDIEKDICEDSYKQNNFKPKQLMFATDYYDYYDDYDDVFNEKYKGDYYDTKPINHNITNILIKVSSTTLATIGITYFLLCVL